MSWYGSMVDSLTGGDSKRAAKREAEKADKRYQSAEDFYDQQEGIAGNYRSDMEANIAEQERRYNNIYAPMERQLASQMGRGADVEGQAAIARNQFGTDFDQSAEASQRQAIRYGVQPGSEQMRRTRDDNTYDRARGMADSANTARREEEDRDFMKRATFFQQNGSGLKGQIGQQLQQMYGSDFDMKGNLASNQSGIGGRYQANSDRYAAEAGNTMSSVVNVATQLGAAYFTGGASLAAGGLMSGMASGGGGGGGGGVSASDALLAKKHGLAGYGTRSGYGASTAGQTSTPNKAIVMGDWAGANTGNGSRGVNPGNTAVQTRREF